MPHMICFILVLSECITRCVFIIKINVAQLVIIYMPVLCRFLYACTRIIMHAVII